MEARFDLGGFEVEGHVLAALDEAQTLSGGDPVDPMTVLGVCARQAKEAGGTAFGAWAKLLPDPLGLVPDAADPAVKSAQSAGAYTFLSPTNPAMAVVATQALAESLDRQRGALKEKGVWGRDLVTLALLAVGDPSLDDLARQADQSLDDLRRQWFDFLIRERKHREPEEWGAWWTAAGLEDPLGGAAEGRAEEGRPPLPSIRDSPFDGEKWLERLTPGARDVLEAAASLASSLGRKRIHMEHLLAAAVNRSPDTLQPVLDDLGLSQGRVVQALVPPGDSALPIAWTVTSVSPGHR